MKRLTIKPLTGLFLLATMLVLSGPAALHAQLVTNGGFENSSTGDISATGTRGWLVQFVNTITPPPVYEIVSDTVRQGNRALKVTVHGLGSNQWDIQIVADSLPVRPGATYNYTVWAKAARAGAQVNFTVGNYSYAEYKAIRPATLTTQWQKYTMTFTVTDNQTIIRAPIHFNYAADTSNAIYIDNLQIVDINAGKLPVIAEAESGVRGSNFPVLQDGVVSYVAVATNFITGGYPGDTSRMITYQVTFADSGKYNLYARVRVGAGGFDDDSFFYGNGFGVKRDTATADWIIVNGLASAGFSDATAVVGGPGALGSGVWKWVNLKNAYQSTPGQPFVVNIDSLEQTFQIGGRENGLDIDKLAFGKTSLSFTVANLDSVQAGTSETPVDTNAIWKGPAIASGMSKFIGCSYAGTDTNFTKYWNQVTPENAGKWGSVGVTSDTSQWIWTGLDAAYNFAKSNHVIFKHHCLIWGAQQPTWISSLDSAAQAGYIETWFRMVGQRYPDMDQIDVVNEPLPGHNPPDGISGRANYKNALGGNGATGWDWVIRAFTLARQYLPNTKLLLNDFGIINDNGATTSLLQIIDLLKSRSLIDGIGVQGHRFELEGADTNMIKGNLSRLAATGLPIYITEFDLGNLGNSGTPNDATQLGLYQRIFPVLWRHPGVKGITLWGYREGQVWQTTCFLVRYTGTSRPALTWMAQFVKDNPVSVAEPAAIVPATFELEQNFPNPFNPTTSIRYGVPRSSQVTLTVFDMLGREIRTLVNEVQPAGQYTVDFDGRGLASGVYFYRLSSGSFNAAKKFVMVK
ncbi:MAG: xylanase [Bacteroidetes bacterium]|nr:xylanase [Bacteroidota bacterium]